MIKSITKEMLKTLNNEMVRINNKKMIISLIQRNKEVTKSFLHKALGVSITTIVNNINELVEEGIVTYAGTGYSTGGRKPAIIRFCPDAYYSIGIELQAEKIRIIITDLNADILMDKRFGYPEDMEPKAIFLRIRNGIDIMLIDADIPKLKVLGVGVSIPGTVDEEKLLLKESVNLKLHHVDFTSLEKIVGLPVYIENEANIAAFAEMKLGMTKDISNIIYISITSKEVGTGIIIKGHLYKGKDKRAGKCGHMKIVVEGNKCVCGQKGCWNAYVSEEALLAHYERVSSKESVLLEEFFEYLKTGEKAAKRVWADYIVYLAAGIGSLIYTFNPNYVIIGGRITKYEEYLLKPLIGEVLKDNMFYSEEDLNIKISHLKDDSSILGASLLGMEKFYSIDDKIHVL